MNDILKFGLLVEVVGEVVLVQTSAILSCALYKFKPLATVEDSTDKSFERTPPPLLLLKQVSTNKFEVPFQVNAEART